MEVSPIEILSLMKNNIYNHFELESINNIDKTYTLQRKSLISLIHKISNQMGFKSQTFFMAVNYLDIIFSKQNNHSYNYGHLAVACLIIAFKYCENVPLKPIFKYFVIFYNNEIPDNQYKTTKEDLFNYEVIICKMLDYKLDYFTIYDFNFFFFGNGIIKIEQLKQINSSFSNIYSSNITTNINNSHQIKKILINIYERSRHYLDVIIENLICLKYNSLLISICIMERSIDYVLLNDLNLTDLDDSLNIEEIKLNNRKYFKQIMNDFYKIDYESLPEYEYLKIDCENFKIFDDIYDKENIKLNKSNNIHSNQVNDIIGNNSSPKNISNNETISNNSPNLNKNNEAKDKISYLYKKVNVPSNSQNNNNGKYNINQIRKKQSPKNRINNSRHNNFLNENSNYKINSSILNTFDNLSKNQNNLKNSFSNKKNGNNMIKCNTSNSPLQNSLKKNKQNLNKNSVFLEKMRNKKRNDDLEEKRRTNSKSIDLKANLIKVNHYYNGDPKLRNKRINVNLQRPYIKKIIQNYDITQEDYSNYKDNKNISININLNNKLSCNDKNENKDKERNKSTKKIIISKFLNKSIVRKKSIAQKSKNNQSSNFESSPIFKRDSSNYKYNCNCVPFKFNKKNCPINTKSINHNISDSNYFQDYENVNSSYINKSPYQKDVILKTKTNFNVYNSNNMTSRNSLKYHNYNSKLTDSLINIKTNKLISDLSNNNDKNNTIIDYNNIDNNSTKKYEHIKTLKNKNQKNYFIGIKSESLNKTNNMMNESNYLESHRNKTSKINNYQNNTSNNININEFIIKDNFDENKEDNNDGKQKSFSNKNLLDYSTGAS